MAPSRRRLLLNGGKTHIPRQRLDELTSKILSPRATSACFSTSRLTCGRARLFGNDSGFFARQNLFTGQMQHFGFRGRQTSAPRSRSAELKIAADLFGTSVAACCQILFRPAVESIGSR